MKLRDSHLAPRPWRLAGHMVSRSVALLPLGVGTLALGMAIYHWVEGLGWLDAFLNAAMLLGGMGPVDPLRTTAGKWLAGCYALLAGVVFLEHGIHGPNAASVAHHILDTFFAKKEGRPLPQVPADFHLDYKDPYAHPGGPVTGGQN